MSDQTTNQGPDPGQPKLTLRTLLAVLDNKAPLADLQGFHTTELIGGQVRFEQDDPKGHPSPRAGRPGAIEVRFLT